MIVNYDGCNIVGEDLGCNVWEMTFMPIEGTGGVPTLPFESSTFDMEGEVRDAVWYDHQARMWVFSTNDEGEYLRMFLYMLEHGGEEADALSWNKVESVNA